ncbi:MAG: hypothetical protein ABUL73_04150 [Alphaproteobacteria bacterium]
MTDNHKKKRTPWAVLVAIVAFVGAAAGFVGNLGGARDAVCKLGALEAPCVRWGLIAPAADPHAAKRALLARVEGVWGNVAEGGKPACTTRLSYAVVPRGADDFDIILRGPDGYESAGHVASAENTSIFTRTMTPASQAGTQWELRLEADRLIQIDKDGTPTPLVRCGQ